MFLNSSNVFSLSEFPLSTPNSGISSLPNDLSSLMPQRRVAGRSRNNRTGHGTTDWFLIKHNHSSTIFITKNIITSEWSDLILWMSQIRSQQADIAFNLLIWECFYIGQGEKLSVFTISHNLIFIGYLQNAGVKTMEGCSKDHTLPWWLRSTLRKDKNTTL